MKLILKNILPLLLIVACNSTTSPNKEMASLLQKVSKDVNVPDNTFCPEAQKAHFDSLIAVTHEPYQLMDLKSSLGMAYLKLGEEQKAIDVYEGLLKTVQESVMFDK